MQEVRYKGYLIRASAKRMPGGRWVPTGSIYSGEGGLINIPALCDGPARAHDTEEQAEELALKLARAWIDGQIREDPAP